MIVTTPEGEPQILIPEFNAYLDEEVESSFTGTQAQGIAAGIHAEFALPARALTLPSAKGEVRRSVVVVKTRVKDQFLVIASHRQYYAWARAERKRNFIEPAPPAPVVPTVGMGVVATHDIYLDETEKVLLIEPGTLGTVVNVTEHGFWVGWESRSSLMIHHGKSDFLYGIHVSTREETPA